MSTAAKSRLGIVCLCVFLLIAGLGGLVNHNALAQAAREELLYSQDFEEGIPPEWNLGPGWDVIDFQGNRVLLGSAPERLPSFAVLEDMLWGQQPFRVRYRFLSEFGSYTTSLPLNFQEDGTFRYGVTINSVDGFLWAEIFRQSSMAAGEIQARSERFQYDPGRWYWVDVFYDNGQLVLDITPEDARSPLLTLSYRDPEPLLPGLLGFEALQGQILLDDLEIWGEREAIPPQDEVYYFSGQTFVGGMEDRSQPLDEVYLEILGTNSLDGDDLEWLAETLSHAGGFYELAVPAAFEFYKIHATAPEEFEPSGAASIFGQVIEPDWVEFQPPFEGVEIPGTDFFFFQTEVIPPAPGYLISGQVFEGEPGDRSQPLPGIRVEIRGTNDPDSDEDVLLGDTTSDANGYFELPLPLEFEVYRLQAIVPPGFEPAVEPNIEGMEVTSEWMRFTYPLDVLAERDNSFFLQRVEEPTLTPREGDGGPPPTDGGGDDGDGQGIPPWVWVGGGLVLLGGGLLFFRLLRGPGDPTRPGRPLPPVPGLPPVRLINVWLTEGSGGRGKFLRPDRTLAAGNSYTLHAQIQSRQNQTRRDAREAEQTGRVIPLEVVFFAPEGDFTVLGRRRVTVTLPATGDSGEVQIPLQPLESGPARVRVGVYYRNVLIQSAYIDLRVTDKPRKQADAIQRGVDYVAVSRFQLLERLGSPRLSIFTNQAADGSHCIGLTSNDPAAPAWLQEGVIYTFTADKLRGFAEQLRDTLRTAAGYTRYIMDYDPPPDELSLHDRERDLIDLAVRGRLIFDDLFLSQMDGLPRDQVLSWLEWLKVPGVISIARLQDDNTTFPWAGLYSYKLQDTHRSQLQVCPIYKAWVQTSKWQDRKHLDGDPQDLLSDPQACRQQVNCPLSGENSRHIICPFGFWGFLHQVEQPIKQVKPVPVNQVPEELENPAYETTSRITVSPGEPVRIDVATYAQILFVGDHVKWLKALQEKGLVDLKEASGESETLKMLEQGGMHLLYLFCHGESENKQFRFVVGSQADPGYISANVLEWPDWQWSVPPQPLVFLNACKSGESTPELIHGFLGKLSKLGASGVIGVEIDNYAEFAHLFGELFVEKLLANRTVGEAFLDIRRTFVRQGNPLGLVYSLHGSANLHLHREPDCPVCAAGSRGEAEASASR